MKRLKETTPRNTSSRGELQGMIVVSTDLSSNIRLDRLESQNKFLRRISKWELGPQNCMVESQINCK